jgi:predicted small secreted protein
MKLVALLSALLVSIGALVVGCNTAQVTAPAVQDAGLPCAQRAPIVTCDASAPTSPTSCTGGAMLQPIVSEGVDASFVVPTGSYEQGCTISFWAQDVSSADCIRTESCACDPDAGASEGGPAAWSCGL